MSLRDVVIEGFGKQAVQTASEKGYLGTDFMNAVTKGGRGQVSIEEDKFQVKISYNSFKQMVDEGVFSKALVEAFEASDKRLNALDEQRKGYFARLWDTIKYQEVIRAGYPVVYCPTSIKDEPGLQVNIRRYGLAGDTPKTWKPG